MAGNVEEKGVVKMNKYPQQSAVNRSNPHLSAVGKFRINMYPHRTPYRGADTTAEDGCHRGLYHRRSKLA